MNPSVYISIYLSIPTPSIYMACTYRHTDTTHSPWSDICCSGGGGSTCGTPFGSASP